MFLCICIVISSVGVIWILKNQWHDNLRNTIAIGIINALQIQITNELFTYLAVILNNFENHRLKLEYYNHLVIKRIVFIVINSFNSLFYIAFYAGGYKTDKDRLFALRIQLLTLFFTAIVFQNSWEILFPWFWVKFKQHCIRKLKKKNKKNDDENKRKTDIRPLMQQTDNELDDIIEEDEEKMSKDEVLQEKEDKHIINDINNQLLLDPMPSLLDNTAEVVVLHGYIILFIVVFPAMPILALINNYFELGIDYYNLLKSQRPVPYTSNGIGVWKHVITSFNIIAVFSNMGLVCFRTPLIKDISFIQSDIHVIIWFFVICMALISCMVIIRDIVPDQSQSTQNAIKRQRQCEKFFNVNSKSKQEDNALLTV